MSARRWIVAVVVGAAWFASESAMGLTVQVQGASASPGDTPDVCVYLPDNDGTVAGVQLDLFWDSSCLSVDRSSGDQAACVMNPETKRSTFQTRVLSEGRLRALLVSLNDVSPIPANVRQLFCCQFRVSPNAGGRTCGVNLSNVIASNSNGQRLSVTGVPGSIAVAGGAQAGGVRAGGVGPGKVMAPAVIEGGSAPQAPVAAGAGGGPGAGGPAVAPVQGGAVGAAPPAAPAVPAVPAGAPGAVPVAPQPAMQAEPAAAEGEAAPQGTAAATPASTEKPAPTKEATKATSPAKTPGGVGTPTPEIKKSPVGPTPAGATPAATPATPHAGGAKQKGKKKASSKQQGE